MKDMTCSFAAAWVRETRAARNADQPTTPWAFRAHGVRRGKRVGPAARRLGPHPGSRGSLQLQPAGGDARQVSTATPSHGRRACAERTDRIGVRPVDTLPGGPNLLKPDRTGRVENTRRIRRLSVAFTEAPTHRAPGLRDLTNFGINRAGLQPFRDRVVRPIAKSHGIKQSHIVADIGRNAITAFTPAKCIHTPA